MGTQISDPMRNALLQELDLSERIVRNGDSVVPRFRVATAYGTFILFAPIEKRRQDRIKSARLVKGYMMWQLAQWFVMSSQSMTPDGISSVLIARDRRLSARRLIKRHPLRVSDCEWLDESSIDPDIQTLLPERSATMNRKLYAQLMSGFDGARIEVAGPL